MPVSLHSCRPYTSITWDSCTSSPTAVMERNSLSKRGTAGPMTSQAWWGAPENTLTAKWERKSLSKRGTAGPMTSQAWSGAPENTLTAKGERKSLSKRGTAGPMTSQAWWGDPENTLTAKWERLGIKRFLHFSKMLRTNVKTTKKGFPAGHAHTSLQCMQFAACCTWATHSTCKHDRDETAGAWGLCTQALEK